MSADQPKAKKIVITPEEVAMAPTRKIAARAPTKTISTVASSSQQQPQVLQLDYQSINQATINQIEGSGVTFIQVDDSGEVSTIDGSLLGQDIAIQITGDDPPTNNEEVLEAPITEESDTGFLSIQYPTPDNHRHEILEFIETVLIKESEKYADLAIFCSDGVVWSSKLILASASSFVKDLLSGVPNIDDTCLVLPHMTKVEFLTFQSALFSKDETQQSDMYSVIKGKSLSYDKFI